MKLKLIVTEGVHAGNTVEITSFPFLIGRASVCNLRPISDLVSKQHCSLVSRAGTVFVYDLNSTNGTFVNKKRITEPTELHDSDILEVSPLVFKVRLEGCVSVGASPHSPTKLAKDTQVKEVNGEPLMDISNSVELAVRSVTARQRLHQGF